MNTQSQPDRSNHHDLVSQNTSLRDSMAQTSRQLSRLHHTFERKAKAMAARSIRDEEPAAEQVPVAVV